MQKRTVQRGRPAGSTTFDAELAQAFGVAVRALRTERGIAQETLANLAGIERSVSAPQTPSFRDSLRRDQLLSLEIAGQEGLGGRSRCGASTGP